MSAPEPRPTRTLVMSVRYLGSVAHGWQRQPNAPSVQALLERALAAVEPGSAPKLSGASRTDSGVHARMQIAAAEVRADVPPKNWVKALNGQLPAGVAVTWAAWGPDGFAPRHSAGAKTYAYRFRFAPTPDPFWDDRAWWLPEPLDRSALPALAASWQGRHDFRAACSAHWSGQGGTVRTLSLCEYTDDGELGVFRVRSKGFLMHQVRILAGTLIARARGLRDEAAIAAALSRGQRDGLGTTAPPHGLTLEHVGLPRRGWSAAWPTRHPDDPSV